MVNVVDYNFYMYNVSSMVSMNLLLTPMHTCTYLPTGRCYEIEIFPRFCSSFYM